IAGPEFATGTSSLTVTPTVSDTKCPSVAVAMTRTDPRLRTCSPAASACLRLSDSVAVTVTSPVVKSPIEPPGGGVNVKVIATGPPLVPKCAVICVAESHTQTSSLPAAPSVLPTSPDRTVENANVVSGDDPAVNERVSKAVSAALAGFVPVALGLPGPSASSSSGSVAASPPVGGVCVTGTEASSLAGSVWSLSAVAVLSMSPSPPPSLSISACVTVCAAVSRQVSPTSSAPWGDAASATGTMLPGLAFGSVTTTPVTAVLP